MGLDYRLGRQDKYTRYKVYKGDVDIHESATLKNYLVGVIYAKDVTSYNDQVDNFNNHIFTRKTAQIETNDIIDIAPNDYLYCCSEKQWYIVETGVQKTSINETQRYSARPSNVTIIPIRRAN